MTIKIYDLMRDETFEMFDFMYKFYVDDIKVIEDFERKFIDHYSFREIGFETVHEFKWKLRSHLNLVAPLYEQLYHTELKSKDIEFLLNKDLKEEFIRDVSIDEKGLERDDINKNSVANNCVNTITDDTSKSKNTNTNTNSYKESNLNDGVAKANLNENYLTNVNMNTLSEIQNTENEGKTTNDSNGTTSINDIEQNNKHIDKTNKENEKTTLISKGNIGTTSSATLLREWRSVLQNLDEMLIKSCSNLFLQIY